MTVYDGVMIGVVVLGMIWGAFRGLTWHLASVGSLVIGVVFGVPLSGRLSGYFPGEPIVARSLALLAVYVGIAVGVFAVAWVVRFVLKRLGIEPLDRHLGMVLGGLEAAVLAVLGTVFVVSVAPGTRAEVFSSPTGHVVGRLLGTIEPMLPREMQAALGPFWSAESVAELGGGEKGRVAAPRDVKSTEPSGARGGSGGERDGQAAVIGRMLLDGVDDQLKRMSQDNGKGVDR
jgi:membrane protein required for colicin V production